MDNIDKIKREIEEVDTAMMDLKKISNSDSNCKVLGIDTIDIDLKKFNIDEWGESVKPVKGIISLITRDYGNFHLDIEVADLVFLMEDGSFRAIKD